MKPLLPSRRQILKASLMGIPYLPFADFGTLLAASPSSRFSVEVYIWLQLLNCQHRSLSDGLPEIFSSAKAAGFRNIELTDVFFTPDLSARSLSLLQANQLRTPSVYVHGAMHEMTAGAETEQRALSVLALAKPAGCRAIVCNPEPKAAGEKTDQELDTQAMLVNRLGRKLSAEGANLRLHNHKVELHANAREWRYMLNHTDPKVVSICLDIDWVKQAGYEPMDLLREADSRVSEIHIRSSRNLVWQESVEGGGDVDYKPIATFLKKQRLEPLVVVELAYAEGTTVSRTLEDDLRRSRVFAEQTFDGSV
jgi:sugar phosphate isomerase/epimerase